jgi:phosphotransferase system HPr (HPr) family protein
MNGDTLRRTVTVTDPQGLHMRPAARFAKRARDFQCDVTVRRDDRTANGKSQLELVLLVAEQGMPLVLEVAGADAAEALAVLGDVLAAACCDEDDDAGPPPKG